MPDIVTLMRETEQAGWLAGIAQSPVQVYGPGARPRLGLQLLPERTVNNNIYREEAVKFRAMIANAGARYSPAQKKQGVFVSTFLVELGYSDLLLELDARAYDAIKGNLAAGNIEGARAVLLNLPALVNQGLIDHNEKMVWDAIVTSMVTRVGDNSFEEVVEYANPAGHRFNAGGSWSDPTYDPFDDIFAGADLLASKGYKTARIITGSPVRSIMGSNTLVRTRVGMPIANTGGTITVAMGRASTEAINASLMQDDLPALELYNEQYTNQEGTDYFLARNVVVMLGTTNEEEVIDLGNEENILANTLGYTAVGTPASMDATPGRKITSKIETFDVPNIANAGRQASLPVITQPDAIVVIGNIA
jgi:hypothetical protein